LTYFSNKLIHKFNNTKKSEDFQEKKKCLIKDSTLFETTPEKTTNPSKTVLPLERGG